MKHEEARTYVKNHLQRSGHKRDIIVSLQLVMRWWNLLNVAVFYGKLHSPSKISIYKIPKAWASCERDGLDYRGNRRTHLKMNETFATKRMFLDVLVHEMVHVWEHQHHTTMGHGKRFRIWARRIKRTTGLDLEIRMADWEYL